VTLLVRNATVVDPSQRLHQRLDILIEDGVIAALDRDIPTSRAQHVLDAKGLIAAPGFVDLHVHLREPGGESSETIETGMRAAAAGGFTTIFAMPNTNPVCDTTTGVQYILSRAAELARIRVVPVGCVTRGQMGEDLADLGSLHAAGAGAFSDDGRPIMNAGLMRRALEYTRMLGVPILDHCEDLSLTGDGQIHEGVAALRLGITGIPRCSESIIVARDVTLAELARGHVHIMHVSTRESVEAIRAGKRHGTHVTAEVTPHHLTLTEDAIDGYNTNAKMKPPLNMEKDRQALIAALEDGTIDCISTDHAPHSPTSKATVFEQAPYGILGLESAFAVLCTEFVATGKWTLDFLIEKMTIAPTQVVAGTWGTLRPGACADLCLIAAGGKPWTFDLGAIRSRSRNSPWLGKDFKACIAGTIAQGRVVHLLPHLFAGEKKGAKPTIPAALLAGIDGHAAPDMSL
jgi:dihydroorotase